MPTKSEIRKVQERYDGVIRSALAREFFDRTGHCIAIGDDPSGLYVIGIGYPALPETHDRWEWMGLRAAKKARAEGRINILPTDSSNKDYALSELVDRLRVLEEFTLVNREAGL